DLKLPEGSEIAALLHGGDAARIVATVHIPKVIIEPEDELVDEADIEAGDAEAGDAEAGDTEATPDEGADADE
ncbi:MAG: 50S ribosomal protein L25, partial [Gammaproteobacteria bacterium]